MSQCQINADFNDFQTNGMSSTIVWQPSSANNVVCYSSDWQPSFFVNQDSLLNVRITGEIYIDESTGDDDFIGFVFGYKSPIIGTPANENRFYLFDWKKTGQHAPEEYGGFLAKEGFTLSYANGIIPSDPINTYRHFWGHEEGEHFNVVEENYGNDLGWEFNTSYFFELIYTHKNIIIRINGEEIFNVDGCFPSGLFGLYTFNQNGTEFSNVNIEQVYDIQFSTDEDDYCEEIPINFSFIDTACSSIPSSLTAYEWSFGDGSSPDYDMMASHSFYDPGPYDVELRITNTNACIDTISKFIFIEPKPQIQQHPQDQTCIVGDQVRFSINADYAESYQWYYQTTSMDYWSRVQNNGYFSGSNTSELTIYNVRPNFDEMKLRCVVNGKCFNLVTSQEGQVLIYDIPVRAYFNPVDDELCTYDSTILVLTIQEPYQIDKANIRLLYDDSAFDFADYTTYLQNMIVNVESDSNYINLDINVINPINLDEAIFASFDFNSISEDSGLADFSWDTENTWFIDENKDTILQYLYNSQIQLNEPLSTNYEDTVNICRGDELSLEEEQYLHINWNTGENTNSIIPQNEGIYAIELIDINHCQSIDSFYVQLDDQPIKPFAINLSEDYFCSFDDSIKFSIEGGEGNCLKYSFNDTVILDSLTLNKNYTTINPGSSFDISASWMNLCGESASLSKFVDIRPEAVPGLDLISDHEGLELGDRVTIDAEITDGGEWPHLLWYIDNKLVQMGSKTFFSTNELRKTQELNVILNSNASCILGSSIVSNRMILELNSNDEYYIPTVVTPNGDGVDDAFRVFFKRDNVERFYLSIYDLRGRLLYSTKEINNEWNGSETLYSGGIQILTYFITYKTLESAEKNISGKFLLKK